MARGTRLVAVLALMLCARATASARLCIADYPEDLPVHGTVVRPNSRAAANVKVILYRADRPGEEVATAISDRRGRFSMRVPAGRRYLVVGTIGNERGEVGPFELTAATAPILIVLRKKT